jgi:hypothetical protein
MNPDAKHPRWISGGVAEASVREDSDAVITNIPTARAFETRGPEKMLNQRGPVHGLKITTDRHRGDRAEDPVTADAVKRRSCADWSRCIGIVGVELEPNGLCAVG